MLDILSATFVENLKLSGVVVVIGIGMVFLILILLIGIVQALKYINAGLNVWDDYMFFVRQKKSEINAIIVPIQEHYESDIDDMKSNKSDKIISKSEFITQKKARKTQFLGDMEAALVEVSAITAKYAEVGIARKAAHGKISTLKAEEKTEFKKIISLVSSPDDKKAAKAARLVSVDALVRELDVIKSKLAVTISLIINGKNSTFDSEPAVCELCSTNDNEVAAAIMAAISIITASESATKLVTFKVRNIKQVK